MVFYRKYRPQTLEQLIGQELVSSVLLKAFQSNKLSHAYLFCGPRGVGKTSTARLLAKLVNCETSGSTDLPCNNCASCISITDGTNLDLIEIDAASNRGIDDIRELRDKVKLAPSQSKKKVYIIDEVHMLTTEAFNALLKTLEEPPSHVMFILATTEVHKIPQTILSRVQKLEFKEASVQDCLTALKRVVAEEKLEVDDDALLEIAKRAEGSYRDALKLLDHLASGNEKKITLELVEQNTRSGSFDQSIEILTAVAQKQTETALERVVQVSQIGTNMKEFTHSLMEILRAVLFIQNGVNLQTKNNYGEAKFVNLQTLATLFSKEEVVRVLTLLQDAAEKMKYTSLPSLPLEIAIVESSFDSRVSVSAPAIQQHPTVIQQAGIQVSERITVLPVDNVVAETKATDDVVGAPVDPSTDELPKLLDKWTYVLETIKPYNFSLEALLKQVTVRSCIAGVVELEVPYSFHQRILEAPKSRSLLESVLAEVLEKPAKITCVLGARPIGVEEVANVEVAADDEVIKIAAEIFNS